MSVKHIILSGLIQLLLSAPLFSQDRMTVYSSFLKFPNSAFDVSLGLDYAHRITKKKWSSGRIYVVGSPYLLWKGYSFAQGKLDDPGLSSQYDNYQIVLPVLLRFEFAPNRLILGRSPGKHDRDGAIFWEIGLASHYLLATHLQENYTDGTTRFSFNGSLDPSSRMSVTYLAFAFGARVSHLSLYFRYFQNVKETSFRDVTAGWPSPVHSYFFQSYATGSFNRQNRDYILLCLGYYF